MRIAFPRAERSGLTLVEILVVLGMSSAVTFLVLSLQKPLAESEKGAQKVASQIQATALQNQADTRGTQGMIQPIICPDGFLRGIQANRIGICTSDAPPSANKVALASAQCPGTDVMVGLKEDGKPKCIPAGRQAGTSRVLTTVGPGLAICLDSEVAVYPYAEKSLGKYTFTYEEPHRVRVSVLGAGPPPALRAGRKFRNQMHSAREITQEELFTKRIGALGAAPEAMHNPFEALRGECRLISGEPSVRGIACLVGGKGYPCTVVCRAGEQAILNQAAMRERIPSSIEYEANESGARLTCASDHPVPCLAQCVSMNHLAQEGGK
jgi:hypothetical protein